MRQTPGNIFIDTNILIYAYSKTDLDKQLIARKLVADNFSNISTQVLQEFCNALNKKFRVPWKAIEKALVENIENNIIYTNTEANVLYACNLVETYGYSFYDSLIISSALHLQCEILYTEDLQHNQVIEGRLRIINPFVPSV